MSEKHVNVMVESEGGSESEIESKKANGLKISSVN